MRLSTPPRPTSTASCSSRAAAPNWRSRPTIRCSTCQACRPARWSTRAWCSPSTSATSTPTCRISASRPRFAMFHQRYSTNTCPQLVAGAAVPHAGAQRRDQHHRGQPSTGAEPREAAARTRRLLPTTSSRLLPLVIAARLGLRERSTTCSRCWCRGGIDADAGEAHADAAGLAERRRPSMPDLRAFYEYYATASWSRGTARPASSLTDGR